MMVKKKSFLSPVRRCPKITEIEQFFVDNVSKAIPQRGPKWSDFTANALSLMLSACKYFIKWVLIYATKTYITKTYAKKHSKVINYTNIVQDGSAVSKGGPQMSAMSAFSTQRV